MRKGGRNADNSEEVKNTYSKSANSEQAKKNIEAKHKRSQELKAATAKRVRKIEEEVQEEIARQKAEEARTGRKTARSDKRAKAEKSASRTESGLTEQERQFVDAYMTHGNATRASMEAGFLLNTYGAHASNASELLKKKLVALEIKKRREYLKLDSVMSSIEVMSLYSAIARGEVRDQFDLDPTLSDRLKALDRVKEFTVDMDIKEKHIEALQKNVADAKDNQITINLNMDF